LKLGMLYSAAGMGERVQGPSKQRYRHDAFPIEERCAWVIWIGGALAR
jgi:hypothetical protein